MNRLETLYDAHAGAGLPLPSELSAFYGSLGFPSHPGRPYVISNFVSSVDGVVSLDAGGKAVGDVISGSSDQDSMVMGLLRAAADVVMVGAGTLRASPQHIWTPRHIYPPLAGAYSMLRDRTGKGPSPLVVIVTASGNIDLTLPLFHSDGVPVLIITTMEGSVRINQLALPESVQLIEGRNVAALTARKILTLIGEVSPSSKTILIEGGPHLVGEFFEETCLDELFLTLAPQVAGRKSPGERLGVVEGRIFAPDHPVWGTVVSVKRAESHLFLRYAFESTGVIAN